MFDRNDCINSKKYSPNFAKKLATNLTAYGWTLSLMVLFQAQVINESAVLKWSRKSLLKITNPCKNGMCAVV